MSIRLMTAAWGANLDVSRKIVLLSLCDNANDQGECYPSISAMVQKCSLAERTIQAAIAELESAGYLRRHFRSGRSTVYFIADPRNWCTPATDAPPQRMHPTPATGAPPPPQLVHPTPATGAPITIKEPSVEPPTDQGGPPAGAADQVFDHGAIVQVLSEAGIPHHRLLRPADREHIGDWVGRGIRKSELIAAVDQARQSKGDEPLSTGYLDKIVQRLMWQREHGGAAPAEARDVEAALWAEVRAAIRAAAKPTAWSDPRIEPALQQLGGFYLLSEKTSRELDFKGNDFVSILRQIPKGRAA